MKREYIIGIVIALLGLALIWFIYDRYQPFTANTKVVVNNSINGQTVTLTQSVISQHNTAADCWLVISGQVYNVSSYLSAHPGGAASVLPYCGQSDGTAAFATKGGRGNDHSATAYAELNPFKLGALDSTITTTAIDTTQNVNIPSVRGEEEDDD